MSVVQVSSRSHSRTSALCSAGLSCARVSASSTVSESGMSAFHHCFGDLSSLKYLDQANHGRSNFMRIAVLGGGPAGLYFAILMQDRWPQTEITVYERNRPDDMFGFGVVFSDATLDTFEQYDRESYRAITHNFAYWDDIEIRFKGTVHRIGGNGFCGCSRRTLLMLLHDRARALGVKLQFQTDITDIDQLPPADLVVAADGINSMVRETFREHFQPEVDLRPNRFTWMGSTRPLDAFTFSFRETPYGIFISHAYQYEPGHSTWVMEVSADAFERAGLPAMDEQESARFLERVFAEDLGGH